MDKRIAIVKKVGRILTVAALVAVAGQFAVPGVAHAKRAKCAAVPVPGKPGTFVVTCSTARP